MDSSRRSKSENSFFGLGSRWRVNKLRLCFAMMTLAMCVLLEPVESAVMKREVETTDAESDNTIDEGEQVVTDYPAAEEEEDVVEYQFMNCIQATDCLLDCTQWLGGNMHLEHDCFPVFDYNSGYSYMCRCHFGPSIDHSQDDEESNELMDPNWFS